MIIVLIFQINMLSMFKLINYYIFIINTKMPFSDSVTVTKCICLCQLILEFELPWFDCIILEFLEFFRRFIVNEQ